VGRGGAVRIAGDGPGGGGAGDGTRPDRGRTHHAGQVVLRRVMQAQWEATDAAAVATHRHLSSLRTWQGDGTDELEVASRFGRLTVRRQMLEYGRTGQHVTPGNVVVPLHGGIVITRGLQEVACLLPDTLPFVTAERLLGWQNQAAPAVPVAVPGLCKSTLGTVVGEHGAALAEAELGEMARLRAALTRGDGAAQDLCPRLLPARAPCWRAGWPSALSAAGDPSLAAGVRRGRPRGCAPPTGSACSPRGARNGPRRPRTCAD